MLHYTSLGRLARVKHASLLDQLISYEDCEVL
jgi:hypothetical protein